METRTAHTGVIDVFFGQTPREVATDRRKLLAVVAWLTAAGCYAVGWAAMGSGDLDAVAWVMVGTIASWIQTAWVERARGAVMVVAISTVRATAWMIVFLGVIGLARLLDPQVPDGLPWLGGAWSAAALLTVVGQFRWDRARPPRGARLVAMMGLGLMIIAFVGLAGIPDGAVASGVPLVTGIALLVVAIRAMRLE